MSSGPYILVALLIFTSCTRNAHINRSAQTSNTVKTDTGLKIDFFETVPDKIKGCGEYFTYDTSSFENRRYVFLSNLSDFALIKVNGKEIVLYKDRTKSESINNRNYVAVYKGQGYTAVLRMKQTEAYDEGGFYSGTLEIFGSGTNGTFKVHGEAGC